MSACARCGKDNDSRYKFCLGCGAELGAAPPRARTTSSPGAPTVLADAPTDPSLPPVAEALPKPEDPSAWPAASRGSRICTTCSTVVAEGFKFCPSCGSAVSSVAATGSMRAASPSGKTVGRLVLIRPDGSEGGSHPLTEGENLIGRETGGLFEADGYLSPRHAELVLNAAGLVVRDLASLNGVFVRISGEEELFDGDILRIGQELLRFDVIGAPQPLEDGTEILGSPNPGYWGRLAVIVARDLDGMAWPLLGDAVILGRERGDIIFPEDGYVSGSHARFSASDGRFYVTDLNSSNGTFLRVRGERPIASGSQLLMGQQLFRVVY